MSKTVLAILISDLHLSDKPPLARSQEKDWYSAMQRPLDEIKMLAALHVCPVICSGDVFDKWNSPPKLINWAYDHLPTMYAIPGQHDLPLHRYEDMKDSAYWTLVDTKRIYNLGADTPTKLCSKDVEFYLHAFPWGWDPEPLNTNNVTGNHIAVVHKYIWVGENKYNNAPLEANLGQFDEAFCDYDAVVVGDNHKGFLTKLMDSEGNELDVPVFNCGSMMRRKTDEEDYCPRVGLLLEDFSILPYDLDITGDILTPSIEDLTEQFDSSGMKEFAKDLNALGGDPLDFRNALRMYINHNKVNTQIVEKIMEAIEAGG